MMRAVQVHQFGGVDQLQIEAIERPTPGAGEVLLRVQAAGVLPADNKRREGVFRGLPTQFPYIPGASVAGVIAAVGVGITEFVPGQAVFGRSAKGAFAEYVTPSAETLALKPDAISFAEAATVSGGATTAWISLIDNANLQAGQRVLIHAAAGGVGLFAVQFARWKGAEVFGTASTENLDYVRSLGAQAIDYTTMPFEQVVGKVDVVLDSIGGVFQRSLSVVRPGGIIVSIVEEPDPALAAQYGIRAVKNSAAPPFPSTRLLETIGRLMAAGTVKTLVAREYPLDEVREAHEQVASGHGRGRVVLRISD